MRSGSQLCGRSVRRVLCLQWDQLCRCECVPCEVADVAVEDTSQPLDAPTLSGVGARSTTLSWSQR